MTTDNNNFSKDDNLNSSLENTENNTTGSQRTVEVQGTTFTEEEIKEANKPQRNVILNTIGGSGIGTSDADTDYRDNERVNARANEAPDSTDTNTGGISSGGAKGANQS
jgi:hypothetical protein